jgi:menaquinone-dependent protoporphyrinogen oxidase
MTEEISRRNFLKTTAITAGAVGLVVCGGGTLAATYKTKIEMPNFTFGDHTMENQILVAYASKAGSVADVAIRIGETLASKNLCVDVKPAAEVTDLTPYSTVVLGSAIRGGQLLPDAMNLIKNNQAALKQKTFNAFIVCLTLKDDTEENRKTVSAYLDPVRTLVQPASEGMFAGAIFPKKLNLVERLIMKAMKAPEGDYRNWDQISAWADKIV